METEKLTSFINQFEGFTKKPEKYISLQEEQSESMKLLIKDLYNYTKQKENFKNKNYEALEELVIAGLDEEQIWQQIELQNNVIYDTLVSDVSHLLAKKDSLKFPVKEKKKKKLLKNSVKENGFDEEEEQITTQQKKEKKKKQKAPVQQSIVDDKFFKLHEMEKFLEKVEKGEKISDDDDEDDAEIDYFENDLSDNEESDDENKKQFHYSDFFDQPYDEDDDTLRNETKSSKKVRFSETIKENQNVEESSDDNSDEFEEDGEEEEEDSKMENSDNGEGSIDEEEDEEIDMDDIEGESGDENENEDDDEFSDSPTDNSQHPSTFEARQERLKLRIKNLEEEALKEKPWQLKGEVTASNRPQNSLLEEYVEFDIASRPAPVLTEKSTLKLEDVIMQRIKDKAWDDVVRKIKPLENELEYKKKLVLDQEKSKLSLAQIYEQEYLKQLDSKNENGMEKPEIEPPEHQEIKIMMNKLFYKLDALSNFHFTPKQVSPEVKVISNLPAIAMEEVAPVATSDATLLAPEEVKPKPKGDLIGKSERTKTDKKRELRQKKLKQKIKYKQMEAKAKAKLEKTDSKSPSNKKISQKLLQKITKSKNVTQLEENKDEKYIRSSNAFFSKLQSETSGKINKKGLDLKKAKLGKINVKKSKAR